MKGWQQMIYDLEPTDIPLVTDHRNSTGGISIHNKDENNAWWTVRFQPCKEHITVLREAADILEANHAAICRAREALGL